MQILFQAALLGKVNFWSQLLPMTRVPAATLPHTKLQLGLRNVPSAGKSCSAELVLMISVSSWMTIQAPLAITVGVEERVSFLYDW